VSTKKVARASKDELRAEYSQSNLGVGVRGEYFERATSANNIVVLDPDVAHTLPTAEAVSDTLPPLATVAKKASRKKNRDARVGAA
jgi:hypothetical protein